MCLPVLDIQGHHLTLPLSGMLGKYICVKYLNSRYWVQKRIPELEKSRIRETLNLSVCANSSNNKKWLKKVQQRLKTV